MPKHRIASSTAANGRPVWPHSHITTMTADLARNQWVKKIRGRVHSFGIVSDRAGRWSFEDFPDGQSALMLVAARLRHVAGTCWGRRPRRHVPAA